MDREAGSGRLLHRGVPVDVVGMAMRVEDLDHAQALLFCGCEHFGLAHRWIDDDRFAPLVVNEVRAVVVRRNAPREDPHSFVAGAEPPAPPFQTPRGRQVLDPMLVPCARSLSRTPRRRSRSVRAGPRSSPSGTW